jgi:hypothetical protein
MMRWDIVIGSKLSRFTQLIEIKLAYIFVLETSARTNIAKAIIKLLEVHKYLKFYFLFNLPNLECINPPALCVF